MINIAINEGGAPVEIAPGRGDLRRGSLPFVYDLRRYLELVNRNVSFAKIYAQQPMIASCIDWLQRQSRRVPLRLYRRVEGTQSMMLAARDHPLAAAFERPWERGSQVDLISYLLGSFLIHGNTAAPIDNGARNKIQFEEADWRYTMPIMPWRGEIAGWEINQDQSDPERKRFLGAEQVLHIKQWGPLGPLGISPLEKLGVTVAIEDAAHRHQRSMLTNGARPPSAIELSDQYLGFDKDERKLLMDNFRADVDRLYAGPENNGRPALMPPGAGWKAIGHTAVEAELMEQRQVNKIESLGLFGLTPATQGVILRSAELAEQRQMAILEGLAPPLILIEQSITAQIADFLLGEPDLFAAFDFSQILRGDKLREIEAIRDAIGCAVLSPNEGRDELGKERSSLPEMDQFYLPRNNLIPVDVPYVPNANGAAVGATEGD